MKSVPTHKSKLGVLICPRCSFEHEGIYKSSEGWLCQKCKYDFGEINDEDWTEKEVAAVYCDSCGREVTCTSENFNILTTELEVMCPSCQDQPIGIFYRGKWRPPQEFLNLNGKDGFHPVKTIREKYALHVLNKMAKKDEISFRSVSPEDTKVLWKNGKAIGYHTVNEANGIPCGRQIFVVPEERRRGYGTFMFNVFLSKHDKVVIESPNGTMLKLLEKMGLVSIDEKGFAHSRGRVSFISGM